MVSTSWQQPGVEAIVGYGAGAVAGTFASWLGTLSESECPLLSKTMKTVQVALAAFQTIRFLPTACAVPVLLGSYIVMPLSSVLLAQVGEKMNSPLIRQFSQWIEKIEPIVMAVSRVAMIATAAIAMSSDLYSATLIGTILTILQIPSWIGDLNTNS